MLKRIMRGLEFSKKNLALDLIAEIGRRYVYVSKVWQLEEQNINRNIREEMFWGAD